MSEARAVVFDLDDTLYPRRRFVLSGFAVVADHVARESGVPRARVFRALCHASHVAKGQEFQQLCDRIGWPRSEVTRLVSIVRSHTPRIRLARTTIRMLTALRPTWRIGVLTNGPVAVQRRKIAALGLPRLVDTVVFATECGTGQGKPDPAPFLAVLDRLNTHALRSVFVGDNLEADIFGASDVGMRTIHVVPIGGPFGGRVGGRGAPVAPDARVRSVWRVPFVAERLVPGGHCDDRI
jgi:putative hydrolase of the HAD superfamily